MISNLKSIFLSSRTYVLILLILTCYSCKKDDPIIIDEDKTFVETLEPTSAGEKGILLNGKINTNETVSDHGFLLSRSNFKNTDSVGLYRLGKAGGAGLFNKKIDFYLDSGVTYYYKAYIKKEDSLYTGLSKSFVYKGNLYSTIKQISKSPYHMGDTVLISGTGFGSDPLNVYFVNSMIGIPYFNLSTVLSSTDSTIRCIIPTLKGKQSEIEIHNAEGRRLASFNSLNLEAPVINSYTTSGYIGDTIVIKGNHFDIDTSRIQVNFQVSTYNSSKAQIVSASRTMLKVVVPNVYGYKPLISVTAQLQQVSAAGTFSFNTPEFTSGPTNVKYGDVVRIYGKNLFLYQVNDRYLDINTFMFAATSYTKDYMEFQIPYGAFSHRKGTLTLTSQGLPNLTYDKFYLTNKYFWASTLPFLPGVYRSSFVLNNEAWVLGSATGDGTSNARMYKFNPSDYSWTGYDLPFGSSAYSAVSTGNKIYIYDALAKLWEFNPLSGTSVLITETPRSGNPGRLFTIGANLYLILNTVSTTTGNVAELYVFRPSTSDWKRLKDLAQVAFGANPYSFVVNNKAYFYTVNDLILWTYNPATDQWTEVGKLPKLSKLGSPVISNNKVYMTGSASYESEEMMWMYNPVTNLWTDQGPTTGLTRYSYFAFILGEKMFFGGNPLRNFRASDLIETDRPQ